MSDGKQLVNYDAEYAKRAARFADQERLSSGSFMSVKGGILSLGEEVMPGNQACVIILDAVVENTYYGEAYVEGAPQPPTCYAYARGADEIDRMGPHPTMQIDLNYFKPESSTCKACPQNEWGSAEKGKGKACQNRRRLAMIPAGFFKPKRGSRDFDLELFTEQKFFASADIVMLKLPVLSVKNWSRYAQQLIAPPLSRDPSGIITRFWVEPDTKAQYMVHFEMVDKVPPELYETIEARRLEAEASIMRGYNPPDETQPQRAAPQGSLRGLRR
jgi:hypothetical protein